MTQLQKSSQKSRMEEAAAEATSVVDYELPTKIGYWNEKLAVKHEKMTLIRNKRGRCETLTIRKNIMFENLEYPLSLAEPNKYFRYGDPIQITTDQIQTSAVGVPSSVLATIITERDIDVTLTLCHGCPIVASSHKEPCRRNVFTIVDPKHGRSGARVTYGHDIYICMYDSGTQKTLYVQAMVPSLDDFGGANEHYALRLCECPDRYCKFKIIHFLADLRDVHVGDDVYSNTKICLAHTVSNRLLVTENHYVPTLFGAEMAVSCYRYKEHNVETPVNFWQISIKKQRDLKESLHANG